MSGSKHGQECHGVSYNHRINNIAATSIDYTSSTTPITAFADSGCTGKFLLIDSPCTNRQSTDNGIKVTLPYGTSIQASHTALLDLPNLPPNARTAHIFPDLNNTILISIGQFCDNGCEARFTQHHVNIDNINNGRTILRGPCDPTTGLWTIDLQPPNGTSLPQNQFPVVPLPFSSCPQSNNVHAHFKKRDIAQYIHAACGSPVPSTWLKAIEAGYFTTWPGLTTELVRRHLPKSMATAKGHLREEHQVLRSTKTTPTSHLSENSIKPVITTNNQPSIQTHWVYMEPIELTGQIYSDQTGKFPITSSRGTKYIMIVYDFDSNAILSEPLKSRNEH